MTHANGEARFSDGTALLFEYNGTSDTIMPWLYATPEELRENWRREDEPPECFHTMPTVELAMLSNDYGDGMHWPGLVCRSCMLIVSPLYWDGWMGFEADGGPKWEADDA